MMRPFFRFPLDAARILLQLRFSPIRALLRQPGVNRPGAPLTENRPGARDDARKFYGQPELQPRHGRLRLFVLALLLLNIAGLSQNSALIMKHADNLDVARKRGILLLQGRVQFVHDSIQFRTQRATWNKDAEIVQCDGGFLFTHPSGFIQAQNGIYKKKQGEATASGNVRAADSANTYMFTGEYLIYDRENEILTMPSRPKLFQFEHQKDSVIDTVTIEARRIIYKKKDSYAEAFQEVKVTQKDMVFTCDTGYFDRKNNWLSMKGKPTFDMKNYHLTGDSIFLVLDSTGKSMKSALVIRNAHGIQQEDPKKGAPGSVTEAFGDTLYCEFADNKIQRLYVNLNAKGFFYETDLPDYRNLMDGDRLDLYFNRGKMDHAVVSGKAQSTYFYVKKDRTVSGKNEATGDTINILFDAQKNAVKSLKLLGNSALASGRYIDLEKARRNEEAKRKAQADSLAALGLAIPDSLQRKPLNARSQAKHAKASPVDDNQEATGDRPHVTPKDSTDFMNVKDRAKATADTTGPQTPQTPKPKSAQGFRQSLFKNVSKHSKEENAK